MPDITVYTKPFACNAAPRRRLSIKLISNTALSTSPTTPTPANTSGAGLQAPVVVTPTTHRSGVKPDHIKAAAAA